MFGQARSIESWSSVARQALIALALLLLSPASAIALGLLAIMLAPVALVGIPFMLPVFFGNAAAERQHVLEHRSLYPLRPALAVVR